MKLLVIIITLLISSAVGAQTGTVRLYNPFANASQEIAEAIKKAKASKKHVLIQAGGNWCGWCLEFNRFTTTDTEIDSLIKSDYIVYHLNYSPENKNKTVFSKYGFPQRFGFPVFLVLDENGNRIHTQNSSYLEQGRSYNKKKVITFLQHWNRQAVDPSVYKNF